MAAISLPAAVIIEGEYNKNLNEANQANIEKLDEMHVDELKNIFDGIQSSSFSEAVEEVKQKFDSLEKNTNNNLEDDKLKSEKIESFIPLKIESETGDMEYIKLENKNGQIENPKLTVRLFLDLNYSSQIYGKVGTTSIELNDYFLQVLFDANTNTFMVKNNTKQLIYDFINKLQEYLKIRKYELKTIALKKYYLLSDDYSDNKMKDTKIFMNKSLIYYNDNDKLEEKPDNSLKEISGFREFDLSIPIKISGGISYFMGPPDKLGNMNKAEMNVNANKTKSFEENLEELIENFISNDVIDEVMLKNITDDYNYDGKIYEKFNKMIAD